MNHNILSMLGLARRGAMLAVGEEPVEAAARAKDARVLFVAGDAAGNTVRRVQHFAEEGSCLWLQVPFTKTELGRCVGRTSCAVLALTDIGFAAAVVRRLADEDPAAFGEAADKLDVKARRAAERKSEQYAHERNLRRGLRKPAPETMTHPAEPAEKPLGSDDRPRAGGRPQSGDRPRAGGRPQSGDRPRAGGRPQSGDRPRAGGRPQSGDRPRAGGRPQSGGAGRHFGPDHSGRAKSATPYAHSHPVKKGKGSFRKKEGS